MAYLIDEVGPEAFFAYLSKIAQVAFVDSRVIFAHKQIHPSDNDRFYSDLFMLDKIEDPWVRQFSKAARDADITVVLGGHSIVAGGMWALVDAILKEQQVEYSQHKLYRFSIGEDSKLANKSVGELKELLPVGVGLYGVTRPSSAKQRAFTYIKPQQGLFVSAGYELHLAGPEATIKEVEILANG